MIYSSYSSSSSIPFLFPLYDMNDLPFTAHLYETVLLCVVFMFVSSLLQMEPLLLLLKFSILIERPKHRRRDKVQKSILENRSKKREERDLEKEIRKRDR